MKETLGIRNLNPLNIRQTHEKWLGQEFSEGHFCKFRTLYYGIRAAIKLLYNYRLKYGLKTPRQIVSRWAPPTENDTKAYIQFVADQCTDGKPDKEIDFKNDRQICCLFFAMAKMESGLTPDPMVTPTVYDIIKQMKILNWQKL